MKSKILEILRSADSVVSGESLSAVMGISRESVWNLIQKLQAVGYVFEISSRGYQLLTSPDIPFSWEFPDREKSIHYFPEVPSTMDIAKDMARKGASHFSDVVAGRQTCGRGRLRRTWHSEIGGLYFTLILRPDIPVQWCFRINFAASLVLCRILQMEMRIPAAVKWPNDILVNGRKLSGMLSEMETEADRVSFITVGIGINVNNDPAMVEPAACSLKQLTGKPVSTRALLASYLDALESYLDHVDCDDIIDEWKAMNCTIGKQVRVVSAQEISTGLAVDVDPAGALILKQSDGLLKKILFGDCMMEPERNLSAKVG